MRPDTLMGRRLAARALQVVDAQPAEHASQAGVLDLTIPAASAPPDAVRAAAKVAMRAGQTHYTDAAGIASLCAAIASWSTADGFPIVAERVIVTNGASEALTLALQSAVRAGTRVALAGPMDPRVTELVAFFGGVAVPLPVAARDGFRAQPMDITGSGASVLLVASPSSVSGVALSPDLLARTIDAGLRNDMLVIVDRSLAWCCYDPASARLDDPALGARVLTIGSFSNAFDMQGWRVGYVTAPADDLVPMHDLKQSMSICTSSIAQHAAVAALEASEDWLQQRRVTLDARVAMVQATVGDAGMLAMTPDAWPFLLLDTRLIHPDDRRAAAMIAENTGVIVQPASMFGAACAGYVRIRVDVDEATLRTGLKRLLAFHSTCQ